MNLSNPSPKKQSNKNKKVWSVIGAIFILTIVVGALSQINRTDSNNSDPQPPQESAIVLRVKNALSKHDEETKDELASAGGYLGKIQSVGPAVSSDSVKVNVSTYFKDPEQGKTIARNIFNVICVDVKELNSLYVVSKSNGLESQSIYRNESACQ